jgi:flagellar biosynthesis/type III secretory pathway M-ring protein FliF/YscJ
VGVEPNVTAGSLGAPSAAVAAETQTREKKEATFDNRFSQFEESVEVPAGELKGLAVNVVLDRAAVRRVLQAEESSRLSAERRTAEKVESDSQIVNFTVEGKVGANNLDQAIDAYRRLQTGFLMGQLPQSGARVNVSVIPFPRPEMPVEVAASRRAMGWASDHWGDLLLGSIVIAGLFLLYRMFQRALPQPLDVPPLDETALQQEALAADEEVRKLEAALASTARKVAGATVELDAEGVDQRIVDSVKSANTLTRENPELASAVIRMWMAEKSAQE